MPDGLNAEALWIARNIVNQIGDFYHERIPSPDWVRVRQSTNDELDAFAAQLISEFARKRGHGHTFDRNGFCEVCGFADPDYLTSLGDES